MPQEEITDVPFEGESENPGPFNFTNEPTFGQRLMSVDFNPNANQEVAQIKQKFAEIADILDLKFMGSVSNDVATMNIIAGHAMQSLLQAQMAAVKAITAA